MCRLCDDVHCPGYVPGIHQGPVQLVPAREIIPTLVPRGTETDDDASGIHTSLFKGHALILN